MLFKVLKYELTHVWFKGSCEIKTNANGRNSGDIPRYAISLENQKLNVKNHKKEGWNFCF